MCGFYCLSRGFGTAYIAVFEDNEGAKNLAQKPVCTSNSKYIDVRTPVLRELILGGDIWLPVLFEFEFLSTVQHPAATCATQFRRARRRGDAFRRAVRRVRLNRVSAVVCVFV